MSLHTLVLLLTLSVSSSERAEGYVQSRTSSGKPLKWLKSGGARLAIGGYPKNKNGLAPQQVFESVVRSLQRWKKAGAGSMTFDYWQGEDPGVYIPNSEYNGLSSLYFSSQKKSGSPLGSGVIGMTQTWYNAETGELLETDVELNDLQYQFTQNPADTTRNGLKVFIENILSHEFGHALGFAHNSGLQGTMLFNEAPEQAVLSCDDQVGMQSVYPTVQIMSMRGTIEGRVVTSGGTPIFGASVQLIHEGRGVSIAQGVTDRDGSFRVSSLPFGRYRVLIEPFENAAQNLPQYFAQAKSNVCDGRSFSRTFSDQVVSLSGGIVGAGTITVDCNMNRETPSEVVASGESFSVVGEFTQSDTQEITLQDLGGDVELNIVGFTLFSPLHVSMKLLDQFGNEQNVEYTDLVQESQSGYVNYNSKLKVSGLPVGDYRVRLKAFLLPGNVYPMGGATVDRNAFFVLTGQRGSIPSSGLSLHPRCAQSDNFESYSSPAGGPERSSMNTGRAKVGFCGSVRVSGEEVTRDLNKMGVSQENQDSEIIAWFLPYLLMLVVGLSHRILHSTFQVSFQMSRQNTSQKASNES